MALCPLALLSPTVLKLTTILKNKSDGKYGRVNERHRVPFSLFSIYFFLFLIFLLAAYFFKRDISSFVKVTLLNLKEN